MPASEKSAEQKRCGRRDLNPGLQAWKASTFEDCVLTRLDHDHIKVSKAFLVFCRLDNAGRYCRKALRRIGDILVVANVKEGFLMESGL